MKPTDCKHLIDSYVDWLKHGLSVHTLDNACELTTPFLDRHNDHLQIYAYEDNGKIILTDDGYILEDLEAGGVDFNSPKRKNVLETALRGFGVQTDNGEIRVEASPENLGQRVHTLIQSMLSVNDMFVMAQPRVANFFWDDVREFLDAHEVRYSQRVKMPGRSGYDHAVDFLIPKSKNQPERFVKALNAPDKNTITSYLFSVDDVRANRTNGAVAYAILNDGNKKVSHGAVNALRQYDVRPVVWSERKEHIAELAA